MVDKILIADDDPETLRLVSLMLQRQGYQIVTASNGNQTLGMARTELPDLIILDVMMPDMDGYEVARQLRKQPDTSNIPILMFTAKSQVEDKVTGYESGADDYLTKPVHPAELQAHIRSLLSRAKSRAPASVERGHMVGILAAKGGVGASTLALNLAIAFARRTKKDVVAAELKPGQGTWGVELGLTESQGLANLLRLKPAEITSTT
ncbi:MAG TPA: response regulator, partial [Anaerolineaceae bacterium]|nr:response regulator [Anaerolineaceae bacterium]